ncbi:hypothetical protein ACRAWF_25915 [Streptomyces sp. L7]
MPLSAPITIGYLYDDIGFSNVSLVLVTALALAAVIVTALDGEDLRPQPGTTGRNPRMTAPRRRPPADHQRPSAAPRERQN